MKAATIGALLLLLFSCFVVTRTQPRLAAIARTVKEREETLALLPPAELHVAALGWDAAVVDLLWAQLLVEYGTHWTERREFYGTPRYLDAILELEPTYWPAYKMVDALLVYRPLQGTEEDARLARSYLERGTETRPNDWRVWLEYGQFLAYMAPSFLRDPSDIAKWRRDGAEALGHAVELGAGADKALSAATILTTSGATAHAIRFLEHAYALTPEASEEHEVIGLRLEALRASAERDRTNIVRRAIDARWGAEMAWATRERYLTLGPLVQTPLCAGLSSVVEPACTRDWPAIAEGALAGADFSEPESFEDSP